MTSEFLDPVADRFEGKRPLHTEITQDGCASALQLDVFAGSPHSLFLSAGPAAVYPLPGSSDMVLARASKASSLLERSAGTRR
ncbi:hypothetical protein [Streptomyces hygroscopicus]|uniref:hypothetical protein n=1 Tax=Streptomyces hygroscopicus TaxID=1912 RepID=UPI00223F398D|nr:hypothetical protein [Streptomyces hygroscopicus]